MAGLVLKGGVWVDLLPVVPLLLSAPTVVGLWACWVGFRPLPANPTVKTGRLPAPGGPEAGACLPASPERSTTTVSAAPAEAEQR